MSRMRRWSKNDARGQSMVEMAIVLPIILILILAAVDYAQALSAEQHLENAAHVATLRLLTTPSLSAQANLVPLIEGESGLCPASSSPPCVSATASYAVSNESPGCCDQVAITAIYSYTLLLPGLHNLQIGALRTGTVQINVPAAGVAVTSAPVLTDTLGQLTVTPPGDGTVPAGLTLTCTLYENGVKQAQGACSSGSPFQWTNPSPGGSNPYTATLAQVNGLTSAPGATTGP